MTVDACHQLWGEADEAQHYKSGIIRPWDRILIQRIGQNMLHTLHVTIKHIVGYAIPNNVLQYELSREH